MKPFTFRLQSLDDLRKADRDARRADLALALAEQARIAERRQSLEQRLEEARQQSRAARLAGLMTVEMLVRGQHFEASLHRDLQAALQCESLAEAASAQCRDALTLAEREVQVLEKLYDRQRAEHQLEQARVETRQLDEVAAERYGRKAA
jgi:flagellar export protein FliJ